MPHIQKLTHGKVETFTIAVRQEANKEISNPYTELSSNAFQEYREDLKDALAAHDYERVAVCAALLAQAEGL
ncbi:MAG: hypothetical protein Unbinned4162contig1001_77 [Prokaryotic dsDNA virus sp.]|nr:MAG: hypothetical protein Unbinned4162contig1001_77 [Prokaryotic dsDNA virus sp.]|tara:strand:+ start:34269 stop:34484 length:216 start_codon:yes stop_codon:yes gene_type:complete